MKRGGPDEKDGSSFEELIHALILNDEPDACSKKSAAASTQRVVVLNPKAVLKKILGQKESDGHHKRNKR
jgi:hypothetical protein